MKDKILKTSVFRRWAKKADLTDQALVKAVYEIKEGLVDADLGGGLIKKRIALSGRGKSGGARTLLATNKKGRWIFLFGFSKNEKANLNIKELEALKALSVDLLDLTDTQIKHAVRQEELWEVSYANQKVCF